jgi:hypothetical protein
MKRLILAASLVAALGMVRGLASLALLATSAPIAHADQDSDFLGCLSNHGVDKSHPSEPNRYVVLAIQLEGDDVVGDPRRQGP